MAWTSISVFVLVSLIGSTSAVKHPNVAGGKDTTVKQFPFVVEIRREGNHACNGAIISDQHILTAGQCVKYYRKPDLVDLRVHSGISKRNRTGHVHEILSWTVHPTYDSRHVTVSDDVAVITLKKPIEFNKVQKKINLPNQAIHDYQIAYTVSWGTNGTGPWHIIPNQLQKLEVAVLSSKICQHLIDDIIDETQICAFRSFGKGLCHRSGGAPLVSQGVIVGLFSIFDGTECASGKPDIYTNVFAYKEFIESAMKN